ncbi:GAF domain-containing sensor histidine kinase [Kordiimonas sediminis]|nr:ATP-binding protein [Kordiimonas sediminis]
MRTPTNLTEDHLQVLTQFAKDFIRMHSADDLLWYTAQEIVGRLGFVDCVIYLYEEDKGRLVQKAAFGDKASKDHIIKNAIEIPLGIGVTGSVALNRTAEIVPDIKKDARYVEDLHGMRSELAAPIHIGGKLYGVIDSEHPEPGFFSKSHLEVFTSIAGMLASRLAQWDVLSQLEVSQKGKTESDEKYRLLFEQSDDAMILASENKFELCNAAAARVFKFDSTEEMESIHPSEVSPPFQPDGQKSEDKANQMMAIAMEKGYHRFDWIHRKKTGEDFPVEVSLTRVPHYGQTALFAICRDITERTIAERSIKQALIDAQTANRTKSDFLANMSHELRTPLNAIIGFSDMMANEQLGPHANKKYKEYSEDIQKAGTFLLQLINDILDLAAIDADEKEISQKPLKVREIVEDCFRMIATQKDAKTIDVQYDIQGPVRTIYGDAQAVRQILINLLNNAVKFTPQGGTVRLTIEDAGRDHLLTVSDTGKGIPEQKLATITNRFDRGDQDPFTAVEGIGLGLAIVKSLVDLHGGILTIDSTLHKGTTVSFTLPKDAKA